MLADPYSHLLSILLREPTCYWDFQVDDATNKVDPPFNFFSLTYCGESSKDKSSTVKKSPVQFIARLHGVFSSFHKIVKVLICHVIP